MGVLGDMGRYTQYQTAEAIPEAAKAPGGLAGVGAGLSVGVAMGNQMSQALGGGQTTAAMPPTMCTTDEPAKSTCPWPSPKFAPSCASQPPPQTQFA